MSKQNKRPTKSSKYSQSKKRYGSRDVKSDPRESHVSNHTNELRWYVPDEMVLKNVATYAFGQPLGTIYKMYPNETTAQYDAAEANNNAVPGVCALYVHPAIGISKGLSSAINIAAQDMYTHIRAYNSGSKNYDKSDLMIRCIAIDQLFSLYGYLCRTYAALMRYSALNTYWAEAVVKAMGARYSDLIGTMADFREFINLTANRINTLVVPSTLPLFERHMYLYTTIFKDSPTIKSQLYLFRPTGFWVYNETDHPEGGMLEWEPMPINWTLPVIKQYVNHMIERLLESEDIAVMTGDILKAYGSNVFRVSMISPDYQTEPVYDEIVLSQIHNARIMRFESGHDIVQNNTEGDPRCGSILFEPKLFSEIPLDSKTLIDTRSDDPSAGLVMEATRLTVCAQDAVYNGNTAHWESTDVACGTEIITAGEIYYFASDNGAARTLKTQMFRDCIGFAADSPSTTAGIAVLTEAINIFSHLEKFDWHPEVIPFITSTNNPHKIFGGLRDLDNFIPMDYDDLNKLHTRAVFTEFGLPSNSGSINK